MLDLRCFLAVSFACAAVASATAGEAADRFLAEYGPHHSRLVRLYSGLDVRYKRTSPGKEIAQEDIFRIKFNYRYYIIFGESSKFVKLATGDVVGQGPGAVSGRNGSYSFDLAPGKGGGHLLRRATVFAGPGGNINDKALAPLCFPYAQPHLRQSYLEMATDPDREVLDYGDFGQVDGRPVKRIRYKHTYTDEVKHERAAVEASYLFAPTLGWVCLGERVRPWGGSKTFYNDYRYRPTGDELPAVAGWVSTTRDGDGPPQVTTTYEVLEVKRAEKFSEADCRLSAFGLPEPVGLPVDGGGPPGATPGWAAPAGRETPRYVWLMGAAAGFAALAVLFGWLVRRRRRRAGPVTPVPPLPPGVP